MDLSITVTEPHLIPLPEETDNEMSDVNSPSATVIEKNCPEKSGESAAMQSQT